MPPQPSTDHALRAENAELRARLEEAEETLRAIRAGEVDALVVEGDAGPRIFTLQGLDAEQNRFRGEMLAQVSDAVIAVDTEERITFLNAAAERQYGARAGELLGCPQSEIFTPHWPSPEAEAGMRAALSERGEWRGELIHRTHDGSDLHVEVSATTLHDSDGAGTGYLASIRDITERHQAEAVLRLNTALFFKIIEQAPGGVYVVDSQFRVAQMNAETRPFFAAAAPLIGRDFDEALEIVWGPEVGPQIASIFRHTLATGERYVSPRFSELRHDLGVEQAFEWETQRITLPDGQYGVVCYFQDVTPRERAEAARRESGERLTLAVKCSQVVLFQQDLDLRYTWLQNPVPWCEGSDAIGKRDADLMERAEDAALTEALKREVIRSGVSLRKEVLVRIAGVGRYCDLLVEPLRDAAGLISGVTCAAIDITERKHAEAALRATEERMRMATEATEVGIWEWNLIIGLVHWDAQMFRMYGVAPTPDGFVNYDTWSRAVLPEDLAHQEEVLADTVHRLGKSNREFRILRADDGACRHIQSVETVVQDEEGKAEWIIGTNLDVTERKNAENATREASEAAVAANAAKDRFLATLSHELRTPLTPVLLVAEMYAKSKTLSADLREDFAMIHRNIVLEAQLIDDLLDVSRIQQGKMRFDFKLVDVHEAIARALEMLRSEMEEKGIAVRQDLGASPATIQADPARFLQVLCNLLRNAVKFTPRSGTITLHTARDQSALQISITDTGAGIAAEDLERIFQPFEQVDAQQKSEHGSLGLGLAISAVIVAAHCGRIWAESPGPCQGSTFHLRFPF